MFQKKRIFYDTITTLQGVYSGSIARGFVMPSNDNEGIGKSAIENQ